MNQNDMCSAFHQLHQPGKPLVLYNIWDAGSARAVCKGGAKAIATGSASVAMANGFDDGETIPFTQVLQVAQQIAAAVEVPVSIDFEGGFAREPEALKENLEALLATGTVGINFEDQIVGLSGRYAIEEQATRIAALRAAAEAFGVELFINARTDIYLQEPTGNQSEALLEEAVARAKAYQDAGASGFFAPGLTDAGMIESLCRQTELPVNIMMMEGAPKISRLAELGVARVSFGPGPFISLMAELTGRAAALK